MKKIFDVIIVANGKSTRAGIDKLSYSLGNLMIINKTINCFKNIEYIDKIILVSDNEDFNFDGITRVTGGSTRQESVMSGLKVSTNEYVLIHDGARPFVSKELINLICEETIKHNSAIPYTKPTDTLYNLSNNPKYEDRTNFALIQTPQGFNRTEILEAYNHNNNTSLTDDSSIYLNYKNTINFVYGELSNKKITTIEDLIGLNNKIGIGFDVHRLVENGKPLKLGGINIEYSLGIEAHSDGDVLLHSLSDAILSCAHEKDIGHAFPDNSDDSLDMDSSKILVYALTKLNEKNMIINNISIVIIAQKPKMANYIDSIIDNLSNLCKLDKNSISITATTTENLGILKDGKAICVLSTITCI